MKTKSRTSVGVCEFHRPQQFFLDRNTIVLVCFAHTLQRCDPLSESLCLLIQFLLPHQKPCDIFREDLHHSALVPSL